MPWMAAAVVAAPIVAGIVGNAMGAGDKKKAREAMQQAYQQLEDLGVPPDLSDAILYKEFESQGILTPELEETIKVAKSEVANIKTDASNRDVQQKALQKFLQTGSQGLTAVDKAALNQVRSEVERDAQAKQASILQNMAQRGMGGSGAELAASLSGAQSADQIRSEQADRLAAQAQTAALSAMSQAGTMAGNIRSQDFSEANTRAEAQDALSKWNAQNSQSTQQRNIASKNAAAASNLSNKQSLANTNTQLYNTELARQNEAKRQAYMDKLALAQSKASALTGQANYAQGQADRTASQVAGIGSGVGQGVAAYSQNQSQNEYLDYLKNRDATTKKV